jgi:hypothetical protein
MAFFAVDAANGVWAAPAPRLQVSLSATQVETGGVLAVRVDLRRQAVSDREVRVLYGDQRIVLFPHPGGETGIFAGLAAIPLTASPGMSALNVEWPEGAARRSERVDFEITAGRYGEEVLKVDPRHVKPGPQDLERIRREQEELKQIYASGSRSRLWQGRFQVPVPGEMHGPFGTRRLFNNELQSHRAGVVRLSKDLFYSGNAVVIDHGAGVFTSYSHLSRIDVKVGQRIEKGQAVGLAGATGRVTGPHLHWGVKVNSVNVNPLTFVQVIDRLGGG